jgi:hypothetical protein
MALSGCAQEAGSSGAPAKYLPLARRAVHSWMAPNTSSQDLLYVSGACGGICVFSYPGGALVGELGDPNYPLGECVDASGNVFVANVGFENGTPGIYEYAHGGSSPIAELSDPGYNPESCSIDPTTGNLAVAGDAAAFDRTGVVAIYTGAQGDPTDYADPRIPSLSSCGYDDKGNLFVDGLSYKEAVRFGELPAGGSSFKSIELSQEPSSPLGIQWAGKYLAVAASSTVIYHVAVAGSRGTVVASTLLNGPGSSETRFWIQGGTIVAPYEATSQTYAVGLWRYPAGGRVRKNITGSEFDEGEPFGVVISPADR